MQKVYLLLRQNQQTGPFSLDELLQFHLTPFDLIWIEGKSAGWYYPQEIEPLQPYLNFLKEVPAKAVESSVADLAQPSTPKKIFVSMPAPTAKPEARQEMVKATGDFIKAETGQKPFAASTEAIKEPATPGFSNASVTELKTVYAKSMDEVETDYMNRTYQKAKAKKKPLFSTSGLVVLCLLAGALFAAYKIGNRPKAEEAPALSPETAAVPQPDSSLAENDAPETAAAKPQKAALVSIAAKGKKERNRSVDRPAVALQNPQAAKEDQGNDAVSDYEGADRKPHQPAAMPEEEAQPATEDKTETTAAETAPKEKKKLRDKIFDVFRKKPEEKEAAPAESENGRRSSAHREAGSSLAQMVAVRFSIPNDWMMGIKGAKATLTNKSSETLAKAVIEVGYYNDDNEVVTKKTIQFSNVKSKQSQTVSVPEHETATRLEYTVVSAVGEAPGA